MTNSEILQLAHSNAPVLMDKTASMIAELDAEHPYFVDQVMVDFHIVLDRTNKGLEKNAGVADSAKAAARYIGGKLGPHVAQGGAVRAAGKYIATAVGAGLAVALATDLYDAAKRGITKGGNLKRILDANPDLKRQVRDQKELYTMFDTIHRFAPDLTADPMLGGAMMMNMVGLPIESRTKFVQDLINSRKAVIESKQRQLGLSIANILPSPKSR